jgi:hypothetical protein
MLALGYLAFSTNRACPKKVTICCAMLPTFFGILMGLAGLFGWGLHPDTLIRLLTG